MKNTKKIVQKQVQNHSELEVEFGSRKISNQNFSKMVAIPKTALQNCGCNLDDKDLKVNVALVQKDDTKFIKLTPICEKGNEKLE